MFDRAWTPKAVVFDCDGLLVDTEPWWTVAESSLFARHGHEFGPAEKETVLGRALDVVSADLATLFDRPGEGPAIAHELLDHVISLVGREAQAMPGAEDAVHLAAGRVPVAVASNAPRRLLDVSLRRAGLTDRFPVSVAVEDVEHPKPDPDVYLRACELLGVDPADALALEDSPTGMRAAVAAGMRTIGVTSLPGRDGTADLVVTTLADDDLVAWMRSW